MHSRDSLFTSKWIPTPRRAFKIYRRKFMSIIGKLISCMRQPLTLTKPSLQKVLIGYFYSLRVAHANLSIPNPSPKKFQTGKALPNDGQQVGTMKTWRLSWEFARLVSANAASSSPAKELSWDFTFNSSRFNVTNCWILRFDRIVSHVLTAILHIVAPFRRLSVIILPSRTRHMISYG